MWREDVKIIFEAKTFVRFKKISGRALEESFHWYIVVIHFIEMFAKDFCDKKKISIQNEYNSNGTKTMKNPTISAISSEISQ